MCRLRLICRDLRHGNILLMTFKENSKGDFRVENMLASSMIISNCFAKSSLKI